MVNDGPPSGGEPRLGETAQTVTTDGSGPDPLASRRRRTALRALAARHLLGVAAEMESETDLEVDTGTVPVADLAEDVVRREWSDPEATVPTDPQDHRRDVERALEGEHLPALDDADVVTYDPEAETVTYHPDPAVEDELSLGP